jgi:hypothetical protein
MPTIDDCGHGGKGGGLGVPPGQLQGHGGGGVETAYKPESLGGSDEDEDEDEERGR